MPKISDILAVNKTIHPRLGEVVELTSPELSFIKENGVRVLISQKSAIKLGRELLKLAEGKKFKGPKK